MYIYRKWWLGLCGNSEDGEVVGFWIVLQVEAMGFPNGLGVRYYHKGRRSQGWLFRFLTWTTGRIELPVTTLEKTVWETGFGDPRSGDNKLAVG